MRNKTLIALWGISLVAVGSLSAQQSVAREDDNHWRDFKRKLIWKGPLAKTLLSAGFNEIPDHLYLETIQSLVVVPKEGEKPK